MSFQTLASPKNVSGKTNHIHTLLQVKPTKQNAVLYVGNRINVFMSFRVDKFMILLFYLCHIRARLVVLESVFDMRKFIFEAQCSCI